MKKNQTAFWAILSLAFLTQIYYCKSHVKNLQQKADKRQETHNLEIIISDDFVYNPKEDTLGFFRIHIDKRREERTNISLRSQKRTLRVSLSQDKHLIMIERWELGSDKKTYTRAKNILQPKPPYFYIDILPDKLLKVLITCHQRHAKYNLKLSYSAK